MSFEFKSKHNEFIEEFKQEALKIRPELEANGVIFDLNDWGVLSESIIDSLTKNPHNEFLLSFAEKWALVIGDINIKSPYTKSKRPFELQLNFQDKKLCSFLFGKEIYDMGVYEFFAVQLQSLADGFIIGKPLINGYLKNTKGYRESLMHKLDFQSHRSYIVSWAKTKWIKDVFPEAYEKMMKDGNFLSVEELEEKAKEDSN